MGRLSLDEVYERASALILALAAPLAVLKEKSTKFKNLMKKVEGLKFSEINIQLCCQVELTRLIFL